MTVGVLYAHLRWENNALELLVREIGRNHVFISMNPLAVPLQNSNPSKLKSSNLNRIAPEA